MLHTKTAYLSPLAPLASLGLLLGLAYAFPVSAAPAPVREATLGAEIREIVGRSSTREKEERALESLKAVADRWCNKSHFWQIQLSAVRLSTRLEGSAGCDAHGSSRCGVWHEVVRAEADYRCSRYP